MVRKYLLRKWEKCEAPWTRTPWNGSLDPLAVQCLQRSFAMSWAYWGHRTGNPMATCFLSCCMPAIPWMKDHNIWMHLKTAIAFGFASTEVGESQKISNIASQELLQRVQILNRQHAHLAQEQVLSSVLNARVSMISLIAYPNSFSFRGRMCSELLHTPNYPTSSWVNDAKANAQSRWH